MNLIERDLRHIWHPCSQMKDYETLPPIVIARGKGSYIYDVDGNGYLDAISSWWCNLLGHSNERVNDAVKKQLDDIEQVIFANFSHMPAITLCEKLSQLTPTGLGKFFFTDNGSSAVEAAMKMSFQYHQQTGNPQKKRFMALSDAYHGETLGTLSLGGVDIYSEMYRPLLLDVVRVDGPDCYRCPYGLSRESCGAECASAAEKAFAAHGDDCCALVVEPLVQAAAGMKIYPPVYLKKLKALCERHGVHLIADEIATGYGRTGRMFACDHADVAPDMLCLSKGLTGGYLPMALVVTTDEIYKAFYADYSEHKAFMHSHTYSGSPLGCAAAVEVLNILEEDGVLAHAREKAPVFTEILRDALKDVPWVGEIRHLGLIHAAELVENPETKEPLDASRRYGYQIYKTALKKGVLLRPLGDVMYFNPPLTISEEEWRIATKACAESIMEVLGKRGFKDE